MNQGKFKIKFGIDIRRALTGADLYVRCFQIASILPLFYIFTISSYPLIMTTVNPLSVLFDLGICMIPRTEAFLLSLLYRKTGSELFVYFLLLIIAIAVGFAAGRILRGNAALSVRVHKIVIVLIGSDLILRLLPLAGNRAFGLVPQIAGFLLRLICLVLLVSDLRADTP